MKKTESTWSTGAATIMLAIFGLLLYGSYKIVEGIYKGAKWCWEN